MKDTNTILKKAIYDLLNGKVVYNDAFIPVFDTFIPTDSDELFYYILIQSVTNLDISTKNSNDTDTTVQIVVYTKFPGNATTMIASDIVNQVKGIVYNKVKPVEVQVINCRFVNDVEQGVLDMNNSNNKTNNYKVIERILTLRFKIFQ